jgi:hypothetical protein
MVGYDQRPPIARNLPLLSNLIQVIEYLWFVIIEFIVPFGEWEKNPRLQAKTLVGLRCHAKLPQDLTFRLRSEVPSGLDHQVPQAGYLWRRAPTVTGPYRGSSQPRDPDYAILRQDLWESPQWPRV